MTMFGLPVGAMGGMQLNAKDILGLSARFLVDVNGQNLGSWGSCKGLAVQFDNKAIQVGGYYDHDTYLPERIKYPVVALKRAVNKQDSPVLFAWLQGKADSWMHDVNGAETGENATITLLDASAQPVMTWGLRNAYPAKWTGPELDGASAGIAMEELQLVHEGFL